MEKRSAAYEPAGASLLHGKYGSTERRVFAVSRTTYYTFTVFSLSRNVAFRNNR